VPGPKKSDAMKVKNLFRASQSIELTVLVVVTVTRTANYYTAEDKIEI